MSSSKPLRVLIIRAGTGGPCHAGTDPNVSRSRHSCLPPRLVDIFVAFGARAPRRFNTLTEQFAEGLGFPIAPWPSSTEYLLRYRGAERASVGDG